MNCFDTALLGDYSETRGLVVSPFNPCIVSWFHLLFCSNIFYFLSCAVKILSLNSLSIHNLCIFFLMPYMRCQWHTHYFLPGGGGAWKRLIGGGGLQHYFSMPAWKRSLGGWGGNSDTLLFSFLKIFGSNFQTRSRGITNLYDKHNKYQKGTVGGVSLPIPTPQKKKNYRILRMHLCDALW